LIAPSIGNDARMVAPKYHPTQIVTILTAPGYMTHIELEVGEQLILPPSLGDSLQWDVEAEKNHVFIKPLAANLRTDLA